MPLNVYMLHPAGIPRVLLVTDATHMTRATRALEAALEPIPQPPMNFPRALEAGRFALRELGFQLFLSNALRKFRARVGEPEVNVASYSDGTVRVSLSSPFDASLLDEYVWPLYPGDDLVAVSAAFFSLLAECRLENVQVAETVWLAKATAH